MDVFRRKFEFLSMNPKGGKGSEKDYMYVAGVCVMCYGAGRVCGRPEGTTDSRRFLCIR